MPFSYENYDIKSKTYTSLRQPVGIESQLNHFAGNKLALKDQKLFDAGCGTGNYAINYAESFGELHCADYNESMLKEAEKNLVGKFGKVPSNVMLSTCDVSNLADIDNGTYDALCSNQVLHHLRPDDDFEDLRKACKEFYRILKDGGRLAINTSSPENVRIGMYWAELIPHAFNLWALKGASIEKMTEILKEAGFVDIKVENLYDEIIYDPELYNNPRNFLDIDRFKLCDSAFNLATEEDLQNGVNKVRRLLEANELDEWFENKEKERKQIGQTVNFLAVKTS